MTRLAQLTDEGPELWSHGRVFTLDPSADRLVVGASQAAFLLLQDLVARLPGDALRLVYVLLEGDEASRYTSPSLTRAELDVLLEERGEFLVGDARHQVWIGTEDRTHLLVLDRHDLLFVYGGLDTARARLEERGYVEGELELPAVPALLSSPDYDPDVEDLLGALDWTRSPLQPADTWAPSLPEGAEE